MLNQSTLLIIPDSTNLFQKRVHLWLLAHKTICRYRFAKVECRIQENEWIKGNEIIIDENGMYAIEAQTELGEMIRAKFSVCFLNSKPEFEGGTGSADSPFLVKTAAQLNAIRCDLGASYRLISDVDLSGPEWGIGWYPIGDFELSLDKMGVIIDHKAGFWGCLDGAGYEIKNLTAVYPNKEHIGLMGYLEGTVKNLHLLDANLSGKQYVGGIAGTFCGCIEGVSVSGKLSGDDLIGGIVGEVIENMSDNALVTISKCAFKGCISGKVSDNIKTNAIGGIAAGCSGSQIQISDCTVNAKLQFSGGIFGISGCTPTTIANCLARGKIMTACSSDTSIVYGIGSAYRWTGKEIPEWGVSGCVSAWDEIAFTDGDIADLEYIFDHIGIPPMEVESVSSIPNILLDAKNIKISTMQTPVCYHGAYSFEREKNIISENDLEKMGWDFTSTWKMGDDGWPELQF